MDRSFVLATPDSGTAGLPLVISFHGDGGTGAGARASLPIEDHFLAVYAYPNAADGFQFVYYTLDGRNAERQFTLDLIATLEAELGIDTSHVFLTGFSGGATTINFLGCYLGPDVIRGVGVHSGTLYSVDEGGGPDFTITYGETQVASCPLPNAIIVWGEEDAQAGVTFADGIDTRQTYRGTQGCQDSTTSTPPDPCIAYDGCTRAVTWCQIPGLGHSVWSEAPEAIGTFFSGLQ